MIYVDQVMKIKHFIIENFRAIEHLDIDCADGINVLIGDNGAGKSSVLEALSLLFSWVSARLNVSNGRGQSIRQEDIRHGAFYCFLSVSVVYNGRQYSWSFLKTKPGGKRKLTDRQTDLHQIALLVEAMSASSEDVRSLPIFYGINRNVSTIHLSKNFFNEKERPYSNRVFSGWRPFFNWFYERENEENRMKARFNPNYHDETLDAVRECLAEVFPGYTNLRIEDRPRTRLVIDKNGDSLDFEDLSDGEKSYIALILDIARRVSMTGSSSQSPLVGEGIVFIDEIDLHLHPSWQLLVLANLERIFPACQFLVTSHSPLVLSGMGTSGRLIILGDGRETAVSDIPYGDNGDYILKRFFGLKETRNPDVQREIDAISSELGKNCPNLDFIEKSLEKLSMQGVQFDEAVKMRLLLAQKKKAYAQD